MTRQDFEPLVVSMLNRAILQNIRTYGVKPEEFHNDGVRLWRRLYARTDKK